MHSAIGRSLLTIAAASACLVAQAGSIRFELPELLGEHQLTTLSPYGFPPGSSVTTTPIETSFYVYHVDSARLVIVGSATPGRVRGDGVTRAAEEAAFLPRVTAQPELYGGASIVHFSMDPPPSVFILDQSYSRPFVPGVTPLPGPGATYQLSAKFDVTLMMFPDSFALGSIPYLTPPDPYGYRHHDQGLTIVEPAIARITEAYLILEGPGVVPEPNASLLAALSLATLFAKRRRERLVS